MLSLNSDIKIPADLEAQVHSQTAVGEQYVAAVPAQRRRARLEDGDVIPEDRTTVPPDINTVLGPRPTDGLQAIPRRQPQNRHRRGLHSRSADSVPNSPGSSRVEPRSPSMRGRTSTRSPPSSTSPNRSWTPRPTPRVRSRPGRPTWRRSPANCSDQDPALAGILQKGPGAADEVRQLFDRLQPTLPIVLANLVSIEEVAVTYQPASSSCWCCCRRALPPLQAIGVANRNTKQDYKGDVPDASTSTSTCRRHARPDTCRPSSGRPQLSRTIPTARPATCTAAYRRTSPFNVRGARNLPCTTVPGKRAPTVKMCESDENYVPLNDGYNWKGDPNATLVRAARSAAAAGAATCRSSSTAGSGAAADSGR